MSDEKIYYAIEVPSVSNGLKRTFKKKLEVFEGILRASPNKIFRFSSDFKHEYKSNKWVVTSHTNFHGTATGISDIVKQSNLKVLIFDDFAKAKISKIHLIEDMGNEYKKELIYLQESYERNVPNVEKALSQMLEEYPEYFL